MPDPDARRYRRFAVTFAVELSSGGGVQTCQAEDLGVGGCRVEVLFPLQRGASVRLRLRSDRTAVEATGQATVAWTTRDPPYRAGLAFSDPLAEQAIGFIRAVVGPARLLTATEDG